MQLYLIRHTTPAIATGICYGQADIDVADTFADDAAIIHRKIANITPVACYSSPLQRCTKLAGQLDFKNVQIDERLQELNFGAWEMQAWDTIPRQQLDSWSMDYVNTAPPNGETFTSLACRADDFVSGIKRIHQNQSVVVITHAGIIRALLASVLNLPLTETFKFELRYGGITRLQFSPAFAAVGYINL